MSHHRQLADFLDAQFARHGLPKGLRTDNGSNLVPKEVEEYLEEMGVELRYTTPLWPRANGEVERQSRSLLKCVRAAHAEGKAWRDELDEFLLAYRLTTHNTFNHRKESCGTVVQEKYYH